MTDPVTRLPAAQELAAVQQGVLHWFDRHQRDLPWRRTRNPYRILVSEVMLQQTQVDRVIPYYERFLERFPTVHHLAEAPVAEVIRLWAGLGYNRRAVNLQRAAKAVVEEYGGQFPQDVASLRKLPGVGDYTAGAIACFAFEQDVAFADTNMRRVLHRVFRGEDTARDDRETIAVAEALVPPGEGWRWNQALIEFGALQCTSRRPLCIVCPLQLQCRSFPVAQSRLRRNRAAPVETFEGSNRFYRGRVLAALREAEPGSTGLSLLDLGEQVREDFGPELLPWLDELVRGLERDGLARVAEDDAVYDAGHPATRVALP